MTTRPSTSSSNSPSTVAIFGEVLVDIFPDDRVLGGAPFNVARHLRAFGLQPLLISRAGNDALRDELLHEMTVRGMDTSGIQLDKSHPTGQVQVTLDNGDHHFDILESQAYDYICPETTRGTVLAGAPQLAYFGSLAQRSPTSSAAARQFLQSCHCPVFLDINLRAPWYCKETIIASLEAAHIVKLNQDELAVIAGLCDLQHLPPEAQTRALQRQFMIEQIAVTCGAEGSWLLDQAHQMFRAAPVKCAGTLDTVGAGDAYAAVFMLGLLYGWRLPVTLQRASEYAAAMCGIRGAAPPPADFTVSLMRRWGINNI